MFATLVLLAALTGGDSCVGPECERGAGPVAPPVVALRVDAPAKADDSGLLHYRVILENRSSASAFGVQVRLQLPAGTSFQESRPVDAERQQGMLTWLVGTMPAQSQRVLLVKLKSTGAGPVEACFRVAYEHGVCVTTQAACKPPAGPGAQEQLPQPKATAQLAVVKVAPARQGLGTPILYSLTITNTGRLPIRDVELEDLFPANASYVPGSASDNGQLVGAEGKKIVWRFPALLPQESRTVTFKVRPGAAGTYLNVAHGKGLDPDGQSVVSKEATFTTEISGQATLYMEVRDLIDPLFVNDSTQYRILVRNTGNAPASNIRAVVDVPEGLFITKLGPKPDADASGHRRGEQRVNFPAFALQPREEREFTVEVQALKAGLFRFRTTLTSDILDPAKQALVEEETTTVVGEKPPDSQTRLQAPLRSELAARQK